MKKGNRSWEGYYFGTATLWYVTPVMAIFLTALFISQWPFLVSTYNIVNSTLPKLRERIASMLTPTFAYVVLNCIILAIFANNGLRPKSKSSHTHTHGDETLEPIEIHPPISVATSQTIKKLITSNHDNQFATRATFHDNQFATRATFQENQFATALIYEEENHKDDQFAAEPAFEDNRFATMPIYEEHVQLKTDNHTDAELDRTTINMRSFQAPPRAEVYSPERPNRHRGEKLPGTSRMYKRATSARVISKSINKGKEDTLEATWKAITEGRQSHPPLTRHRHLRKPSHDREDLAAALHVLASEDQGKFKKSETWNGARAGRPENNLANLNLKKDPSLSQEELNRRVEAFISKVNNDMRLQREESLARYTEMVNRGTGSD